MSDVRQRAAGTGREQRRIAVFTATRAEYGLLRWLLAELDVRPDVDLQLLVSGAHLSPEFGLTVEQIESDGFSVAQRVEMLLSSDTPVGATKSLGLAAIGMADALDRLRPDVLVVLGDRYEVLAAAAAALLAGIPVAHVHGGEVTEGALDESVRHAVTKLSRLHFPAAEPFARRLAQLGENPEHVHVVGAPGLDTLRRARLPERSELEQSIGIALHRLLLVTYHPVTLHPEKSMSGLRALLEALDRLPDHQVVVTRPNADPEGRTLTAVIDAWAATQPARVHVATSLGQLRYWGAMRVASAVVGNSSSGLIEAPAVGTPTVNIGIRQQGRLRGPSVVDCGETREEISSALDRVLDPKFAGAVSDTGSPYGDGYASDRIAELLATADLDELRVKRFYDLEPVAAVAEPSTSSTAIRG